MCVYDSPGLDFLGFPWILSSESSLFNGLAAEAWKFFLQLFSLALKVAGTAARGRDHAEAQVCSWAKLTRASDFLQEIVVRALQKWGGFDSLRLAQRG
jgi:hypothetical protein